MLHVKQYIILFITVSKIFGSVSVFELSNFLPKDGGYVNNFYNNININNTTTIKERLKPLLYSSLVPGLGQYYNGKNVKALIFFGMEVAGFIGYYHYLDKGDGFKDAYQEYGQEHWELDTWFSHYYHWNDPIEDLPFFNLFSQDTDGDGVPDTYVKIWEDSHYIEFSYLDDGIRRTLKSNEMEELYNIHYSEDSTSDFVTDFEVEIIRDHNFYENIYKYNHFFAGWTDSTNEDLIEYDSSNAYHTAFSPNKRHYQSLYSDKVDAYKIKRSFTSFIFFTHAASMLDALIDSKLPHDVVDINFAFDSSINCYAIRLRIKL